AQKEAIKAKAGDAADLTALAAFTATVEKINTAQKALADLVAKADTVKASDGYKNASADAKKAYDEAIEKAKTYLADDFAGIDETALNELTASASDVNSAVNAFSNNTVDYSKLEAAVDKENSDNVTETAAYKNATDEEKATYDTALANAKKILAEKTASQNDVDAAVTALTAARAALSGTEAVSGSSIDLRTALIAAGVGVGLIGIIMAASNALQAPAPAPAAEPAPAANTNKGYVHNYVVGGGAERAEGYAENPETLADEGTAAGTEQGATAAPAAAAARANGRLATTGTSASPWLAGLAAMVMGVALFFGFRRREN
ncbi:MAG: LPXTG cell wall anchor domain-containing protein, partial [Corynebacterium sp.]|nr:LPXTG cell wall anchor domain-containing protein [Corynebacterium sp.]